MLSSGKCSQQSTEYNIMNSISQILTFHNLAFCTTHSRDSIGLLLKVPIVKKQWVNEREFFGVGGWMLSWLQISTKRQMSSDTLNSYLNFQLNYWASSYTKENPFQFSLKSYQEKPSWIIFSFPYLMPRGFGKSSMI